MTTDHMLVPEQIHATQRATKCGGWHASRAELALANDSETMHGRHGASHHRSRLIWVALREGSGVRSYPPSLLPIPWGAALVATRLLYTGHSPSSPSPADDGGWFRALCAIGCSSSPLPSLSDDVGGCSARTVCGARLGGTCSSIDSVCVCVHS